MKAIIRHLLALLALAVASASTASAAEIGEIILKPLALPESSVVRLGDVAEILAADSRESQRLAALPLMPAPAPGKKRFLSQREVEDLIAAHGESDLLNVRGVATVEIRTASERVSRFRAAWTGQEIPAARAENAVEPAPLPVDGEQAETIHTELEKLFIDYLGRMSGRNAKWNVTFELTPREAAMLAATKTKFECSGGGTPWTGRQKFVVTYTTDKGTMRLPLFAEVKATQQVVVAVQPVERGALVTPTALELQELENVPVASDKSAPVQTVEALAGMEAKRTIQAGDIVMTNDVQPQILVKRGEEITVFARGGGIQVRTLAKARQDGARGDLILVETLETKEPFAAEITSEREAIVFSGKSAAIDDALAKRPNRQR
jgi:flagella basal body P-ring formation protein FlgA